MNEPPKRGRGRPLVNPAARKKNRAISLTDAEYQRLIELAEQAGAAGVSAYLVKTLKLS